MVVNINGNDYNVDIVYKSNKNMYLRVKDDLTIYVTAPKYIRNSQVEKFINDNISSITKMINTISERNKKGYNKILYLGKYYEINYIENKKVIFTNDKVFINRNMNIDNFYKKQAKILFHERLNYCYALFRENIPYPSLNIRKMTSKWGVCNVTRCVITLNLNLIKLDVKYLDYVIIHELSHLIESNHSRAFWNVVSKYSPNYKIIRKEMKNIL